MNKLLKFKFFFKVFCLLALNAYTYSVSASNLLTDPGFETQPLNTLATIVSNFNTYNGIWGAESATITGTVGGVTPYQGSLMLSETSDGLAYTQTLQIVKLSHLSILV